MGLFDKKYCDICGDKIGLIGNRKLDDGNMCKSCAGLLSPFYTGRRGSSVATIKEHLAYREENRKALAKLNITRTLGRSTKVMLDEDTRQFIVTSASRWQDANPDILDYSSVTGCDIEIRESRTEMKYKDKEGKDVSYVPARYDIDYDFYVTIHVNSPWFSQIQVKINGMRIEERTSAEYRECDKISKEIKEILTKVREDVREDVEAGVVIRGPVVCALCGATTTPDRSGACEYCGGPVKG